MECREDGCVFRSLQNGLSRIDSVFLDAKMYLVWRIQDVEESDRTSQNAWLTRSKQATSQRHSVTLRPNLKISSTQKSFDAGAPHYHDFGA